MILFFGVVVIAVVFVFLEVMTRSWWATAPYGPLEEVDAAYSRLSSQYTSLVQRCTRERPKSSEFKEEKERYFQDSWAYICAGRLRHANYFRWSLPPRLCWPKQVPLDRLPLHCGCQPNDDCLGCHDLFRHAGPDLLA